jgi:hypothetical protein
MEPLFFLCEVPKKKSGRHWDLLAVCHKGTDNIPLTLTYTVFVMPVSV